MTACQRVFFTDEKLFYTNPPVNTQNDRVWSAGRKRDVSPSRLLIERAKFAPRVSAGVCLEGKGRLHFVQEKSKVNADYYVNELLPKLIDDCYHAVAWPKLHISTRWGTCACSEIDPAMACSSLSRLHRQGRMASKQPGFKSA